MSGDELRAWANEVFLHKMWPDITNRALTRLLSGWSGVLFIDSEIRRRGWEYSLYYEIANQVGAYSASVFVGAEVNEFNGRPYQDPCVALISACHAALEVLP